mmetsp:Transcript_89432/g.289238  ORF Transcript_89432/g.289238 Transcript_89432/m.289238 type:complete len:239 (-) Transcript_89432:1576-2292(-)
MLLVLLLEPHVAVGIQVCILVLEALHVMHDGVVGQMHELASVHAFVIVLLASEAQVGLLPDVNGQRVPIRHENPLPDIELVAADQIRFFYVLLADPLEPVALRDLEDLIEFAHHLDAASSRFPGRLHNPSVSPPIDAVLPAIPLHLRERRAHLLDQVLALGVVEAFHRSGELKRLLVLLLFLLLSLLAFFLRLLLLCHLSSFLFVGAFPRGSLPDQRIQGILAEATLQLLGNIVQVHL